MSEIRQGLPIEEIINISTEVQAGGTIRSEFGTGLIMTTSDALSAGGNNKCQRFTNQQQVIDFFGSHDIINDTSVWFGAEPAPKSLYIGRWASSDVNTTLTTGALPENVPNANGVGTRTFEAMVAAISDGSFHLNAANATSISFSGDSTINDIIAGLVSEINGISGIAGATGKWNAEDRTITFDFNTTTDIGLFTTATADVGTDLLGVFMLTPALGAVYNQGSDAETLSTAINRCLPIASGGAPSALLLGSSLPDTYSFASVDYTTKTEIRDYASTGDFMTAIVDTDNDAINLSRAADLAQTGNTLDANPTQSAASYDDQQPNSIVIYSKTEPTGSTDPDPRPDIAVMALLSSQTFELPQSLITLTPKALPNTETTDLTSTQLSNLRDKRSSVYTRIGGVPTFLGGYTSKTGVWADSQWWLMWLKNEMERSIFLNMRSAKRFGNALLVDTINEVMERAVNSGGAKPGGTVTLPITHEIRATTGNQDFDGVLETGYLTWVDPPSGTDRQDRISRFKVWIAPSDAVHTVNGAIILAGG